MKILLADDEPSIQNVIQEIVEDGGYEFCSALDGKSAINIVEQEKPDLIILDVMMPGIDGVEALRIIREESETEYARSLPIIALTANAIVGNEELFLNHGFQAFLSKPIDMSKLDAILRQWVRDKDLEKKHSEADVPPIKATGGELPGGFAVDGVELPQTLESVGGNLAALEDNADEEPASEGNKDEDEPVFTYNTYPNPVQDVLTLEYYTEKPSTITITLLDMQRRPLYNKSNVCRQGDVQHVQINMSSLFKGCYMLIIETDSGVFNEVIFKK